MLVNDDYKDMLSALNDAGVEYLVVGAYALGAHGYPRATGDIDFWVRPSEENAKRAWHAMLAFGTPRSDLSESDFLDPDNVVRIGMPPRCIDLLTSITGVDFDSAWQDRVASEIGGYPVWVLSREHLIANKRAAAEIKTC
ncbi:hypothetical protein MalM25_05060 [Planctomycetes bacterium MalM25]|nr:hypothetical protein MalM25_05060 [Planctomycetes bacterium MalM25]